MNLPLVATGNSFKRFALKKMDASLSSESIKEAHTVLSLSPTGFSVLVSDARKHKVLLLAHSHWEYSNNPEQWVRNYDDALHDLPLRVDHARSTQALLQFQKFSLVPESLYSKGSGRDVLSYTCRLDKGDHIFIDHWNRSEAVMLYSIPIAVADWYQRYFPDAGFRHSATALEQLYSLYPKSELFALLYIERNEADLFIAKEGQLLWYNNFEYQTEEDLLYYLLYTLENNKILPTELLLRVAGKVLKGEKLMVLLERYIGEVEEIDLPLGFEWSSQITEQELRNHLYLLGAL